jgi:hypothetical protein
MAENFDKEQEERIITIAKCLGSGGRTFTPLDIQAVDEFIINAEVQGALAQMILDNAIDVSVVDGEILFQHKKVE